MLFLKLWNYIRGYVIIIVEGYFLEKFMNICIHRQIFLWDVKRRKNNVMTLKISIKGFKLLRPIARKTRCRVRIRSKRGIPFIINRYKGRKTFVIGAVFFCVAIYALTSFIWTIEISGNKTIDTQTLLNNLATHGIKEGTLKYRINPDEIVNDMMLDMKELAWVGVVVKGTKIKIEVAERVNTPNIIQKDIPCDIVAAKDGVIKSLVVKAGYEVVKSGMTVYKGQVLVSGSVPNKNEKEPPRLVHSIASIKARTWYEESVPVKNVLVEKERTGKKTDHYSIGVFTKIIKLFPGRISFKDYDKIEIKKTVSLGGDMVLPFELIIDRYYENNLVQREIDTDESRKLSEEEAYKIASEEIPRNAEVVKKDTKFIQGKDGVEYALVTIECLEDIGVTKEIGGK